MTEPASSFPQPPRKICIRARARASQGEDYGSRTRVGAAAFVLARRLLHGRLHFLEGAHLDLANALPADAELGRQVLERRRLLGQAAGLEDALLAVVEGRHGVGEVALAPVELLGLGKPLLLARRLVDQPVLPLARF